VFKACAVLAFRHCGYLDSPTPAVASRKLVQRDWLSLAEVLVREIRNGLADPSPVLITDELVVWPCKSIEPSLSHKFAQPKPARIRLTNRNLSNNSLFQHFSNLILRT
jgi:hypothetical protein